MSQKIKLVCDAINYHLLALSQGSIKITNMTLVFKIDDKDELWLMFCSNINIRNIVVYELNRKRREKEMIQNKM